MDDGLTVAYLALGSNRGDRAGYLRAAVRKLRAHDRLRDVEASPVYETEAHTLEPDEKQPDYLNAVVGVATDLAPEALLELAHGLEEEAGRDRSVGRWQPRTLDVDLLVVGQQTRQTEQLRLPHPRLGARRFVLQPWADLAPNLHVPAPFDTSVAELLRHCPDPDRPTRASFVL